MQTERSAWLAPTREGTVILLSNDCSVSATIIQRAFTIKEHSEQRRYCHMNDISDEMLVTLAHLDGVFLF